MFYTISFYFPRSSESGRCYGVLFPFDVGLSVCLSACLSTFLSDYIIISIQKRPEKKIFLNTNRTFAEEAREGETSCLYLIKSFFLRSFLDANVCLSVCLSVCTETSNLKQHC